jgi:hypothetical protein
LATFAIFELRRIVGLEEPGRAGEPPAAALGVLFLVFECLAIITPSNAEFRAPVTARLNRPPSKGDAGNSNHLLVDFTAAEKFNYLDTALRTASDSVLWNSSPTVKP